MSEETFIKRLEELKELAFKESTPNISVLKLIKAELFRIKKIDRDFLRAFVGELNDKLFTSNISIQGLDLETYFKVGQQDVEISKEKTVEVTIQDEPVERTFDELLKEFLECIKETIIDLKGYAIIQLSLTIVMAVILFEPFFCL